MKIEKINDKQIRCTISREDLENRHIKLSELAFGTGKTKELFQEMMRQANDDFGFELNDLPLMVEAIPVSTESVVLLITRVDEGDSPEKHISKLFSKETRESLLDAYDDIDLDDFDEITSEETFDQVSENEENDSNSLNLLYSIYIFDELSDIITVAKLLAPIYKGDSSVYKSPFNNKYYLSLCMEMSEPNLINKVCSTLTEHGTVENATYAKDLFYLEHYEEIIFDNAIAKLALL